MLPAPNCACDGKGYIGPTTCSQNLQCYPTTNTYSQCLSPNTCKPSLASSNLKLNAQCIQNGSLIGLCGQGQCFAQNAWYAQCLLFCPVGWACQNSNLNVSNLTLWQDSNHEQIFFQKISDEFWYKISYNSIVATLLVISNVNDTLILNDTIGLKYYALNSQNMYSGSSLNNLLNSSIETSGSWILIYYSARIGNNDIWAFTNRNNQYGYSCFVQLNNVTSIQNSWIRQ